MSASNVEQARRGLGLRLREIRNEKGLTAKGLAALAEAQASQIPAWTEGSPEALRLFAQANSRMWSQVGGSRPLGITGAAQTWAEHRAAR